MTTKTLVLLTFLLFGGLFVHGQQRTKPKKVKAKGDFIQNTTNFVFADNFESFPRQSIYSFNKQDTDIGVVYGNINKSTTISIYVYPAGNQSAEGRLRGEYLKSMQEIANVYNGFGARQIPVRFEDEYICNGYKAIGKSTSNGHNNLTVYECGTWFLKIRISSTDLDSLQIEKIESEITKKYSPSYLTKLKPLNTKAEIYFAKAAFADSLLLISHMGSAFKKLDWANKNLKENEKVSGFPDIYLDMHIASFKELLEFKRTHPERKVWPITKKFLDEVELITNSGFLPEFIMKQFNMIMIVPPNQKFDFDGFEKWRQTNNLTINLNMKYYVIAYGDK